MARVGVRVGVWVRVRVGVRVEDRDTVKVRVRVSEPSCTRSALASAARFSCSDIKPSLTTSVTHAFFSALQSFSGVLAFSMAVTSPLARHAADLAPMYLVRARVRVRVRVRG